ncbi:TolB family protein [Prosthecobacter debontii]|uniref:TolB family protein n=1 Tax=Prosthecobacter debontii TaxID=48467 RepID=UPI0015912E25|nr:hypothetical protein [Prosthecobacter debontii]
MNALLPAFGVLVWPAVYVFGKAMEKPSVVVTAKPTPIVSTPPPQPRYVKPEGFDSANAWKRIVLHEDAIPNTDAKSAIELSRNERQIAFVARERGEHQLVVRHLYDPGPDYSLTVDGGIAAMSWSPDDKRIIFVSGVSGAIWVCVPESGKLIRLPIPALDGGQRYGLVWWRDESVVIYPSRGDPGILSLDSLRIATAAKDPQWAKLTDDERTRIGQEAFTPGMEKTPKAHFAFIGGLGDDSRTLALNDEESLYTRLAASAEHGFTSAFPNRDGTMFFLMEPERLRILYMGLRQSPSLRFVAESKSDFPTAPAVKTALEQRSVRAAVVAPIINPLNGKTVAGNPRTIKGYARFIAADDKTCTVWIEQERQPIREGDVLMTLSAIQDGDEYSISPDWWAVIKAADDNQSVPRRAVVATLMPSRSRDLRPLPEPAPPPAPTPTTAQSPVGPPLLPQPAPQATPPPKPPVPLQTTVRSQSPDPTPQTPKLADEERLRQFIVEHSARFSRGDLENVVSGYGAAIDLGPGKSMSREEFGEMLRRNRAGTTTFTETPVPPIEVTRLSGNRFSLSYVARIEISSPSKPKQIAEVLMDLEVLLTNQGPKIVKQRESTLKVQTSGGRK